MFSKTINFLLTLTSSLAHVSFYPNNLVYTPTSTRFALKVPHGCSSNSTNMIVTQFPDDFIIKPEFKQGWTTDLTYNENSDSFFYNVTWNSNSIENNIPNGFNELFWIWITIPNTYIQNSKYYVPTIQTCYPSGENYWTSTPTNVGDEPAPAFTITSQITQTPTNSPTTFINNYDSESNNNSLDRYDILAISISIISIISFLMNIYNEYRHFIITSNNNVFHNVNNQKQIEVNTV